MWGKKTGIKPNRIKICCCEFVSSVRRTVSFVRIVSLKVFNLNCQASVLKFLKRLLFYRSDSEKAKCDAHDVRLTEDEFLA